MEKSDVVDECCEALMKKMKLGKKRGGLARNPSSVSDSGTVRVTRSMTSKRIAAGANLPAMKKQCSDKSVLETLPQDVLVKILCGVDHSDLKQLLRVSKSIKVATLVARQGHFDHMTPKKARDEGDIEDVPNAPRQERISGPRLSEEKLASITVALFP